MRRSLYCVAIAVILTACGTSGESATPSSVTPSVVSTITVATTPQQEIPATQSRPNTRSTATALATPHAIPYPVGCTPAEVEAFLNRFLAAFNRGDQEALRTFFPTIAAGRSVTDYSGEKFVWYSMTDQRPDGSKRHFVAYDQPALWTYFAERHAQHEMLRLASVTIQVNQQDPFNANMSLFLHRTADDLLPDAGFPPGQATGKVVMNCRDQTLRVFSFGQGRDATPTPTR